MSENATSWISRNSGRMVLVLGVLLFVAMTAVICLKAGGHISVNAFTLNHYKWIADLTGIPYAP